MGLIAAFHAEPWFYIGTLVILGLMVGSFLNVVIHRLPIMMEADWKSQCLEYFGNEILVNSAELPTTVPTEKYNLVVPR